MEESFENILREFTPMIHHIIKSLNIYKEKDFYFHEATIALWEATFTFQQEKGRFSSYAYSSIRGKLLNTLKKERKRETDQTLLEVPDLFFIIHEYQVNENPEDYTQNLTEKQKKWLVEYIYNNKKIEEIAKQEGVSISAVKSWRRQAIKKIKKHFPLQQT